MRTVIFGNAGSGKSTAARKIASRANIPILDLDLVVWEPNQIASTRPADTVHKDLEKFCNKHDSWIVEGCYGDLVKILLKWKPELIFMNPGEETCINNSHKRPWEPHKYASKAEQDAKLAFLLRWISEYYKREDEMSLHYHREIFDAYDGPKREITGNLD